jgi:hypothetical protein
LEKRHFTEKAIPKLILDNGIEITNPDDILTQQKIFYEALYTNKGTVVSDNHFTFFDENNPFIKKLNLEETEALEGDLKPEKMLVALKKHEKWKVSRARRIYNELYKFFWSDLKFFAVRYFNQAYTRGYLSVSQRQGVITCLPKEGKSKFYLKNWRPISLLNVDYKICASATALRFKKVLTYLISDTQMGFMKGRFIGEYTRLICDIIEKCDENNITGVLILLDFEKAFDSVEWNFIRKSLEFLRFGPSIIHWFETFYHNSETCVLNNGHLSKRFKIERGSVKESLYPLMYLFCQLNYSALQLNFTLI